MVLVIAGICSTPPVGQVKTWANSLPSFLVALPQVGSVAKGLAVAPCTLSPYVAIQEARPRRMVTDPAVTEPSPLGPMFSRKLPSRETQVTSS